MRGPDEETLFDQALQVEAGEERERYLDKVCEGDPALRSRLNRLLVAHEQSEAFFKEGAQLLDSMEERSRIREFAEEAVTGDAELVEEPLGVKIGRYNLIKRIGDGGYGVVYLAEQEQPVRRMVALKIIRIGMESSHVIDRFKAERQALAMMDHPHIARVFDAGETQGGSPYFVMEHVRGIKITEYCEVNHLTVRERLQLFVQVCHAIQHAHQKGIIHGDIKPSNIMVCQQDGMAIPKVIDFGVARATEARLVEKDSFSKEEQLVGTPAYMSPEQMDMNGFDVDTRSDIYSLGILLHELMTGRTPLDGGQLAECSAQELRDLLRSFVPQKPSVAMQHLGASELTELAQARHVSPSELMHFLQEDLDWVVMKALQRDRSLRYETANALAMDVQRFLEHHGVVARPASWSYSLLKFMRRNRGVVLATAMVAASLVAGLGLSTWLLFKERAARQRAVAAELQQVRLRQDAETRQRVTQASWLISQEKYANADRLIRDTAITEASMEGAAVVRALGEWHAISGRWEEAVFYFEWLLKVNQLETADVASLDLLELGPAMVRLGDVHRYEAFRWEVLERLNQGIGGFADRFLKISLLQPANAPLVQALRPVVEAASAASVRNAAAGNSFEAAWEAMAVALYYLRSGNYGQAMQWSNQCLAFSDKNAPRTVAVLATRAMAYHMMARNEEGRRDVMEAIELMEARYREGVDRGSPVHGFWFDWVFSQILVEEARALLWPEGF